ncbi:jg14854 [Pararge aegeria aegeria]|uniref:Jg14854 protein n=1 Tax=Pararge aegeria aegeria TaxID=348720 RepID=A0A8S4R6R4_9NEOP|nr:jg14854 [Pararge aegeria aegeria]
MVKENIVRKPACLRVLHNVLNGVKSTNPHLASVEDYGLTRSHQRAAYLGSPASLPEALDDLGGLLSFWSELGWLE